MKFLSKISQEFFGYTIVTLYVSYVNKVSTYVIQSQFAVGAGANRRIMARRGRPPAKRARTEEEASSTAAQPALAAAASAIPIEPIQVAALAAPASTPAPTATPQTQSALTSGLPSIGTEVMHKQLQVCGIVVQHAQEGDFFHRGKVCIQYLTIEKFKKTKVLKTRWCFPTEISVQTCPSQSSLGECPMTSSSSISDVTPRSVQVERAFNTLGVEREPCMEEVAARAPQLSAHEVGRLMPQKTTSKGTGTTWGMCGAHKTNQTKVELEQRVQMFPDQSLCVTVTPKGIMLFCQCCPKEIQNLMGTIKTHLASDRHKERLKKWLQKSTSDNRVAKFLHEYFKKNPNEKDASVNHELQVYRWRVVEACMHAGIPLKKIDRLRTLLERGGLALTSSAHMRSFVAKIEAFEWETLKDEVRGQDVCLIYDGTSRLGECTAVLLRWCSPSFQLEQRLIALRSVAKHMNGDTLGPFLIDVLGSLGVRSSSVVCLSRDSCATNGKAELSIKPILPRCDSMLCVSHTLSHCAEHVDLPVLKEFSTPWLSLVQHHPTAKSMWQDSIGTSMKGFSNIRWFSREEVCNELALNFAALPGYVESLLKDEIGDALPKRMAEILAQNGSALELELACNLDMLPILTACLSLEGDGLTVLLARHKIDSLLSWGETVGDRADSLPNVAALLRSRIELKPGAKVYEYFADAAQPGWFKGEIVMPRCQGLITVKYSDNTKVDQEEREVRQWLDVRELPDWARVVSAAKSGIMYLNKRMNGLLPPNQKHYDCSLMFEQLKVLQSFDPSWAANNLDSNVVNALAMVKSLEALVPQLQTEIHAYLTAAKDVVIDHTESKEDHSFTDQVLKFYQQHGAQFPTWTKAARIVFAFTPSSGAAERVFSTLNHMFKEDQIKAFGDYVQTAVMLCTNKRSVG